MPQLLDHVHTVAGMVPGSRRMYSLGKQSQGNWSTHGFSLDSFVQCRIRITSDSTGLAGRAPEVDQLDLGHWFAFNL